MKFARSVIAPPFLLSAGIGIAIFLSLHFGLALLSTGAVIIQWNVARSFLVSEPPLTFSHESITLEALVNVGFTPWHHIRNLVLDQKSGLMRFEAFKAGYWVVASIDLKDYDIGDGYDFRRRVKKYALAAKVWTQG